MNDHLTPPDEPLDPAAKARIRQQVLAGLDEEKSRGRWAVPIAAAAAVAVVATMAGYVALRSPDTSGTTGAPAAPATTAATSPVAEPTPKEGDASTGTESEPPLPGTEPTPRTERDAACVEGLRYALKGAEPVLDIAGGLTTGTFYVKGDRWAQCTVGPAATTIAGVAPMDAAYTYTEDETTPWQVSTDISDFSRQSMTQLFVAGGPLPEGVTGIGYTFPDGSTRAAEISTDDEGRSWWRMEYVVSDGVLADPHQNQTELDPIEVTISLSGRQYTVQLQWGLDTCAQLNHGC